MELFKSQGQGMSEHVQGCGLSGNFYRENTETEIPSPCVARKNFDVRMCKVKF